MPVFLVDSAAIEVEMKVFFPSEDVTDIFQPSFPAVLLCHQSSWETRSKLESISKTRRTLGGISYLVLSGGPFFDMCTTSPLGHHSFSIYKEFCRLRYDHRACKLGVAGFNIPSRHPTIYVPGNNPTSWTPLPIIVSAALTMLLNPDTVLNRGVLICGVR